jgi:hypothetical protein
MALKHADQALAFAPPCRFLTKLALATAIFSLFETSNGHY